MKTYQLLEVNEKFFKDEPFTIHENDLANFLNKTLTIVDTTNEVYNINDIDIDLTVKHHSGDCRLWYKDGTYIKLTEAKYFIMECKSTDIQYDNIMEWLEDYIPVLYRQHKKFNKYKEQNNGLYSKTY